MNERLRWAKQYVTMRAKNNGYLIVCRPACENRRSGWSKRFVMLQAGGRKDRSLMLKGIGVSSGIGYAKAMIWQTPITKEEIQRKSTAPRKEIVRFEKAHAAIVQRTTELRDKTARQFGDGEAAIFDAYLMIMQDEEELLAPVKELILEREFTAENAVMTRFGELSVQLMSLSDDYMRQRSDDVNALRDQFLRELLGKPLVDISHLDRPTIVVAHALSPTDIAVLDTSRVEGIISETGSYTSHTAIIVRTLGIPAVAALDGALKQVQEGDMVALNGDSGEVWVEPDQTEIAQLRKINDELTENREQAQKYRGLPTITVDGRRVELSASVGQLEEVEGVVEADAESIGMYRTEILHVGRKTLPGEDEQFLVYKTVLEKMGGKAVTVRTYDDGGNRPLLPFKPQKEENPVLGYRGIRMSLSRPSLFRTQLRALLRASAYGPLKIMFPMVSSIDELDEALRAVEQIKKELERENTPFDEKVPVGILVQAPSAALLAEKIAEMVDFISISINDLIQFTLAIDRGNSKLAHLYHPYHPAVLRLVNWVAESAHSRGKPCFLCGEAPGQKRIMPLFLGFGIDGFSINPGLVLQARQMLSSCRYIVIREMAAEALRMNRAAEVEKLIQRNPY